MLPPRRKPKPSGIERAPQREWPRHRKFVRSHACCVPGCENGPIEFAHVRQGHAAGTAQKPPDWLGISLCWEHHGIQHRIGHLAFDGNYQINSLQLAAEFAAASPDVNMKIAMGEAARSATPATGIAGAKKMESEP